MEAPVKVCEFCGKSFHVKPSLFERRRFCSWACHLSFANDPARFWERVDVRGPDECWPWKGHARGRGGSGGMIFEGEPRYAHQIAFRLTNGYWAPYLRHSCDNPPCCNPAHLLEGTHDDNMADMVARGRASHGERHWFAKLTDADIRAIRADPRSNRKIAADYGIDPSLISGIKNRKTWRHVA